MNQAANNMRQWQSHCKLSGLVKFIQLLKKVSYFINVSIVNRRVEEMWLKNVQTWYINIDIYTNNNVFERTLNIEDNRIIIMRTDTSSQDWLVMSVQYVLLTSSSKFETRITQPAWAMPWGILAAARLAAIWLATAGDKPMPIMAAWFMLGSCGSPWCAVRPAGSAGGRPWGIVGMWPNPWDSWWKFCRLGTVKILQ